MFPNSFYLRGNLFPSRGGCRMSDQLSESLASELDGVAQDMAVGRLEDGKMGK